MKRNVREERKGNINTYTLKHTYTHTHTHSWVNNFRTKCPDLSNI